MSEGEEQVQEYWRWTESNWQEPNIAWREAKVVTCGIDVGSVSSQAVIVADGQVLAYGNLRTGSNSPDSARRALDFALQGTGLSEGDLHYCIGTGYGRVNVPMADRALTEIACHARGANFLYGPEVRTVLDVGGQDCKAIRCDSRGKVENFLMNDKCAAGTGRGMEVMADMLSVPITEVGDRSLQVKAEPEAVSSTCVVYAKTEATALLRSGWDINQVLAAYCAAMAVRIHALIRRVEVEERFAITGGLAKNRGVTERLLKRLGTTAMTTEWDTQIAGALGAALFGQTLVAKGKGRKG